MALAVKQGLHCAICGGLAMHLYDFTRATKDIDVMADGELGLTPSKPLSFGGQSYRITLADTDIELDRIVRNDELMEIYQAALRDRIITPTGLPVVAPEWLTIVKHLAGRGKDHMDCVWLLRQDRLVDRDVMVEKN